MATDDKKSEPTEAEISRKGRSIPLSQAEREQRPPCEACGGTGLTADRRRHCSACRGSGKKPVFQSGFQ